MANISNTFDFIWWAMPRSASKSIWEVLTVFDLERYDDNGTWMGFMRGYGAVVPKCSRPEISKWYYSHDYHIPNWAYSRVKDFGIILNTRNPYAKFWSWWIEACNRNTDRHRDENLYMPFEQFVEKQYIEHYIKCRPENKHQMFTNRTARMIKEYRYPDYLIRYENIQESIRELPFIKEYHDHPLVQEKLNRWIDTPYGGWREIDRYHDEMKTAVYTDFYNEELAEKVYLLHQEEFTLFNYEKDSWKINEQ